MSSRTRRAAAAIASRTRRRTREFRDSGQGCIAHPAVLRSARRDKEEECPRAPGAPPRRSHRERAVEPVNSGTVVKDVLRILRCCDRPAVTKKKNVLAHPARRRGDRIENAP